MPKRTKSSVKEACRKLWGKIIMSLGHCEHCWKTTSLQPHHVYGRGISGRLYLDLRNGCCLCAACHFWAEGNPIEFTHWFEHYRPSDTKYLAEQHKKGPLVGPDQRTLDDYLEIEAQLKEELNANR